MNLRKILSNKKIVIASIGAIALVSAAIIGLTTAYFQDVETSVGNKFVAGEFDLMIDSQCSYNGQPQAFCTWLEKDLDGELFFNFGDVKPSDTGEDTVSFHIINNDAWLCAEISNLVNQDNGCRKPEQVIGDTSCGNPGIGEGELQDNILFTVWKDNDCDNVLDPAIPVVPEIPGYCEGANQMCHVPMDGEAVCNQLGQIYGCYWISGTPGTPGIPAEQVLVQDKPAKAGYWAIADSTTGNPIPGDTTICYGVSWKVPLSVSNIIQSDSVVGNLTFNAVQSRGMNNFKCSDLYTEICGDGKDNDYDGETDEGCIVCGDGTIGGTEICELPGTSNNSFCAQSTWRCEGLKIQTRDSYGDCGASCGCTEDSWGPLTCSLRCQAACEEDRECEDNNPATADTCNLTTCGCEYENLGICGNGNVEGTEQCDDGNQSNFDFCNNSCQNIPDNDGDGFAGNDCNDNNANIYPDAPEWCNGIDENCNGYVDDAPYDYVFVYRDADGDGFGNYMDTLSCATPGYVTNFTDCDDTNSGIRPGATDIPGNDLDENCSGKVACYVDADNDTYGTGSGSESSHGASFGHALIEQACSFNNTDSWDDTNDDCNDTNPTIHSCQAGWICSTGACIVAP
jgi:predicted ribosomally synthesized peptide with SipW-like signal peptide